MADAIHVKSIEEVEALQRETVRFVASALALAKRMHAESERSREWVRELARSWTNDVDARASDVSDAVHAYESCLADDDEYIDCSLERAILHDARRELQRSRHNLELVQSWSRQRLTPCIQETDAQISVLEHRLQAEVTAAAQALQRYTKDLRGTAAMRADGGNASAHAGTTPIQFVASGSPSASIPAAAGPSPGALAPISSPHGTMSGMMLYQQGFRMVPVDAIDDRDNPVTGPGDFSKVPYPQMQAGMRTLADSVLPLVQSGADGDFFRGRDQQQGLSYINGQQAIYDAFFGSGHIWLDYQNGAYTVGNGRHRIYLARQMGMTHLPARVSQLQKRR